MAEADQRQEAFPAPSKHATGLVNGVDTEVSSVSFSDRILITISQEGRLAQWVQVPLSAPSAASVDMSLPGAGFSSLPASHLTPTTLLGAGGEARETLGHLYAAQLASHLTLRDPDEKRTLVLGLGMKDVTTAREAFFDVLELVQQVI